MEFSSAYRIEDTYPGFVFQLKSAFIFSKHFILIKMVVDLESIPATLVMRWEYNLEGMLVHHRALSTHSFTLKCNFDMPVKTNKLEEETTMNIGSSCKPPHTHYPKLRIVGWTLKL